MKRVVWVALMAMFVCVGCKTKPSAPETFEHTDALLAYALTLPSAWSDTSDVVGSAYAGGFRRDSSSTLLVSVSRVKLGMSVAEYEAQARRLLEPAGIEMQAPKSMQLAGVEALLVKFSATVAGRQAQGALYYVVRGEVAMLFELGTVPPTSVQLPKLMTEFENGLRWLPGRPAIAEKTYTHAPQRGGGWRLAGDTWWSPTFGLQVDVSRYTIVSDASNQPLGVHLVASDTPRGVTFDISSTVIVTENGVMTTLEEIFGKPDLTKRFRAQLLGKSVDFDVYATDNGTVAAARVRHGTHDFDLTFQLPDRVEAAALQPYLDHIQPLSPEARERLKAKAGTQPRTIAGDLMFDGRAYRNRGAGLRWTLPKGEWQGRIGTPASALSKTARFIAIDVSNGLLVSLSALPDMTPERWQAMTKDYATHTASVPHRLKDQQLPVWQLEGRRISLPFVWSGEYLIAEAVVFGSNSPDTIRQARAALEGIAPLDATWALTKGTAHFAEPYFGLTVRLGSGGRLHAPPNATHLGDNEFLQAFGTGREPSGIVRAIAWPAQEELAEMLNAIVKQGLTSAGQPNTPRTVVRLAEHELSVWTPQTPVLSTKGWAARFATTYANGVGLLINHIGTEAEWKALLKGIEFMPE